MKELIIKNSINVNQISKLVTEARKVEINAKKMAGLGLKTQKTETKTS